jgi:peptidoglycan/xylan/chitin deacetylase (PgdA/CDA1 family)
MGLANHIEIKLISYLGRSLKVRPTQLAAQRPVASITFDDFPKNAWLEGGPVLARHGVKATYYTAGGFCGRQVEATVFYDQADLKALAAAGHEIGCHGFDHQPTPCLTSAQLAADTERNRAFLKPFLGGEAPVSYAFPFGRVSPRTKAFFAPRFTCLRGVHPGVNAGRVDLAQLNAISLEMRCWNKIQIESAIAGAVKDRGWLIFYTHDISERPSDYGSTPEMLDWALSRLVAAGVDILPVREALPVALGLKKPGVTA